jgi:hypothetical protein
MQKATRPVGAENRRVRTMPEPEFGAQTGETQRRIQNTFAKTRGDIRGTIHVGLIRLLPLSSFVPHSRNYGGQAGQVGHRGWLPGVNTPG